MSRWPFVREPRATALSLLRQQVTLVGGLGALLLLAMALPLQGLRIAPGYYLLIHTTVEFVAIVGAFLIFATVWHTPSREGSASLLFIAVALFAAGWLDFSHALSFKGMPDMVTPSSPEKAIALWLAARFLVAATLAGVSLAPELALPSRRMRYDILVAYTVVNAVVLGTVLFHPEDLPRTFVDGVGVTSLKVALEWIITGLLALAAWRYYRQARTTGSDFSALIFSAAAVAALGEVFFTAYSEVNDALNLLGHLYKIVSYSLIYQAMFVISVRAPYVRLAHKTDLLLQANETLRTQALALESTTAPVLVTDAEGRVRWRNRASHQLLVVGPLEQTEGLSLFAAPVTPDPEVAAAMREALLASGRWRGVVELRDDGGKRLIINRMVTSLRSESGVLEGFVSVAENVTENRRARERHKRVLDTAIDGFLIADAHGKLLETNAALARMSGYSASELRNLHVHEFSVTGRLREAQERLRKAGVLGQEQFETRFRHKLGHEVAVVVSLTFDPEVQQYFVFVRDITDQMLSAAVQLDLERQLQQAQKMEALGQLTGGVAHDFNNILASVLGYSKLALDRLVPDKQSKLASYLREVIMASERARDLIAKMLVFSRTKSSAAAQAISPAAVVQEVLAMVRPSIPSSIQLDVRLEDDLSILMDAGDLNQILLNLIINARDAIAGHGVIGIRLHRIEAHGQVCAISGQRLSGPYLALEVSDNGSGIAPAHRLRMFDPFFTTKDVGKGTGLGLSMVQGIVLRSGGHIVVESQLGQGSMFQLLFPIASPVQAAPDQPSDALELLRGAGQRVWVVDDEPAVTRYLGELLEGQGYQVTLCNSPDAALAAFAGASHAVDLLITDQTMPGMSGTELAARLHAVRPELPVILCTGHGGGIDQSDLTRSGIRHFFTKPVAAHDLLQVMAEEWAVGVRTV